jgi:type II secretory pathway component PulC
MAQIRKSKFSNLKVIAIILLLIGSVFTSINLLSTHTILVKKLIQVPEEVSIPHRTVLGSKSGEVRVWSNLYFPAVYIEANQTFQITWASIYFANAFIFTKQQFADYQSNESVDSEATVSAKQDGSVAYYVRDSGYYVAVLNVGANQAVYEFNESVISYTNQINYVIQMRNTPQKDNLYLYLGITFLVAGTVSLLAVIVRHRKQRPKTKML